MLDLNTIHHGDCLQLMQDIPDGSVDMILCDLPYGTTACKWDTIIPFDKLWAQYERIIKPNGAIVLTACQPFSSALVASAFSLFKFGYVWIKNRPTGALQSKNRPMGKHEDVLVFSLAPMGHASQLGGKRMTYNPQGTKAGAIKKVEPCHFPSYVGPRAKQVGKSYTSQVGLPHTVLEFSKDEDHLHPTQKPVALFEYLIKTYTNPGDVVLDNCIGSGTTAIAALKVGRKFIGIEQDLNYYYAALARVFRHQAELPFYPPAPCTKPRQTQ